MTDIKKYTNNIRTAIYGKEVRESLATGIEVINTEVEENTKHVNETVKDIEQFKKDIDSSERQRVSNENTRIANEDTRKEEFKKIVDKNGTWDKQLSDLYNTNNSSLDSLNNNLNALHKSFQSKYDNLEKEYAQEITDVKNVQGQPKANYKIDSLGIHPSSNGFIDDFKLFGKTVIVNNLNEEVEPGTAGAILKSVGDGVDNIEISAIKADNNLFNPNECINEKYVADGGVLEVPSSNPTDFNVAFIKIPIGDFSITISGLTNSVVTGNQSAYIGFYDKNKNPINSSIFNVKNPFTKTFTNSVIGFIAVTVKKENLGTLNVTIGNEVKPYTQYEGSKRNLLYYDSNAKVWEKPILRSANKLVKDTIESSNNKVYYHQKCMELTLNGNENWVFDGDLGNTVRCYLRNSNLKPGLVTSNSLNSIQNYVLDKEHIYASEGFLWVFLSKSKATDLNTFKNYFKGTPTTVVCPMIKEEVYECLDISTRSFNPKTLFLVNGGAVSPEIEAYMPNSLISSVRSISEKLENIDLNSFDLNSIKLPGLNLKDSLDTKYLNINKGDIFNFNETIERGRYSVGSETTLPGAPFPNAIYGSLIVLPRRGKEIQQIFLTIDGYIFSRLFNYLGNWSDWYGIPKLDDFKFANTNKKGYQKLPSGIIIQWGYEELGETRYNFLIKDFYFPLVFPNECLFVGMGNIKSSNPLQDLSGNAVSVGDNGKNMIRLHVRNTTTAILTGTVSACWFAIGR